MSAIELKDPAGFGQEYLRITLLQGFGALTKRDLELLLFLLLERDGAIARTDNSFDVAKLLQVTPAKVRALRRDAYARWRPLLPPEDHADALRRILRGVLTEVNLQAGAKHVSERHRKEGFLAIRIEHPDDFQQFEQAIIDVGAIPVHERNRDVLAVRFDTLLAIAEHWQFIDKDPTKMRQALAALDPAASELAVLLQKDIGSITWADIRSSLVGFSARVISSSAEGALKKLLGVIFPFI